jgi:hypothetical protein
MKIEERFGEAFAARFNAFVESLNVFSTLKQSVQGHGIYADDNVQPALMIIVNSVDDISEELRSISESIMTPYKVIIEVRPKKLL